MRQNNSVCRKRATRRLASVFLVMLCVRGMVTLPRVDAEALATPIVTITPTSGAPGTSVVAAGSGFKARFKGSLRFSSLQVASFRTTSLGTFSVRFTIPPNPPGSVPVTAVASTSSAAATFVVIDPGAAPSSPPPAGGYFQLTGVGGWSSLPGDAEAAAKVRRSSWEPRPRNATANGTVPSNLALGPHGGVQGIWNSWLLPRVTGNFTGTTDEIIQWAAAKWGLPDDLLRAQAVAESYWHQGLLDPEGQPISGSGFGDYTTNQNSCPPGYSVPCPLSFGVLQVKYASYHPGVFPYNRDSTAFNVDYVAAILRGCYEGWESWLRNAGGEGATASNYAAGDIWGCVGRWYSGRWHTEAAELYINKVKNHLSTTPWLSSTF